MTRALGVALVLAAVLAAVIVGLVFLFPRAPAHRRLVAPPGQPSGGPARVGVLVGEAEDRAVVIKQRFAGTKQAEFTDRSLAIACGAPDGAWSFVEVWVVNRSAADLSTLQTPPVLTRADGAPVVLTALRDLASGGARRTPSAEMLVAALAPDPGQLLRKGHFRRTVYGMPASVPFAAFASAEVDGVRLGPRQTTEEALETFMERPRPDLIAALSTPEDVPGTSSRVAAIKEDSR